jgi:carbonic anhydrase
MEHEAIKVSLANLRSFPCIRAREAEGRVTLHGAYFAIDDGLLHILDEASGEFAAV